MTTQIIKYETVYRDDMFFCMLLAKDALGRIPHLPEDLLDIKGNYFDKGDMFWLAIDENDRVVGMLGCRTISDTELWLKRFFIKPMHKCKGIGSDLLTVLEDYAKERGITKLHTRFPDDFSEAAHFYTAKKFVEIEKSGMLRQFVKTI